MNTKVFMMLLIGVLVVGGALGGVVIAATSMGGSDAPEPAQSILAVPATSSLSQQSSLQTSQQQTEPASQASSSRLTQDAGDHTFTGETNLVGTVEKIEADTLTISTSEGSILARVGDEAFIQMFAEVAPEDLTVGTQVAINGERGENGLIVASSIMVVTEGESDFFGSGFFGRGGQDHDDGASAQSSQGQFDQFRQRFQGQFGQSGGTQQFPDQLTQEQLNQFRQQFQGQFRQGAGGGQTFGGRGGLTGTVESIIDGVITIETPRGPLQATITDDTTIQKFSQVTLSDLPVGAQVRLTGQQSEDGTFQASSVFMVPEGDEFGSFGGGFFGGQGGSGQSRFPGGFPSHETETASP